MRVGPPLQNQENRKSTHHQSIIRAHLNAAHAAPDILEWAANEGRILLTHDVATITMYAYQRVNQGLPMLGVIEVIATAPIAKIIDDLELFICCSQPDEYEGRILFIPFPIL